MYDPKLEKLTKALRPLNAWNLQDCRFLGQPAGDTPAATGSQDWRGWPEPGPGWAVEAIGRMGRCLS